VKEKKILEMYIPRGAREGEQIVLAGEADQSPDDSEPGDIVFDVVEAPHETFHRAGADLQADLEISLVEALTGFNRVVLTHLDGRGLQLHVEQPEGKVLRPDDIIKVAGEGMPMKRSDAKGDLYLTVKIIFPEDGWLKSPAEVEKVRAVLPKTEKKEYKVGETPEVIEDVLDWEVVEDLEGFGAGSDDPRAAGAEWEDDEEGGEGPQCAQQ
jgi:DnaJ family protein A protein 2